MRLGDYLKDKASVLLLHVAGLFFLLGFLKLEKNSMTVLCVIALVWIMVLFAWLMMDYRRKKHIFDGIFRQLEELEEPYLIAEVMESSPALTDRLYREALRISNRSVIEKIHELEAAQKDYKEYIESWIHEVKLPLTAAKLICENSAGEEKRKLQPELVRIEKQVEQVLFYARMEHAYQDYLIQRVDLKAVVLTAVASNKAYFIQGNMQIRLEWESEQGIIVSSDEKWVLFLLDQIFANAIKYRKNENACVRIFEKYGQNQVSLIIEDNGIGIAKEDLGRIFDKGFTGKNGRTGRKSTGIGLYLCKGLCDKLGIGITCESKEGEYTRLILTFPDSDYQNPGESFKNVR